jgi:DNA polymerase-3 subunit gamma/tau
MAYQVTARKWRPKLFDDVVGQEHITATLKNAIRNNRIAHAYIFTGPRGVGKTTTARILAKALNCENPQDSEPCNNCSMCRSISDSQSMDIIEIDGASNRGIDEIRTLRESVKYAPTRGTYKVYIIDEVHMLTKESFNAFLKTLEEPPSHTIFIFATTDIHKVPLTIISRCQRFDFRRIQLDTIKNQLKNIANQENISIDDKTLTTISKKADGALRDAQSLFDQVIAFCGNNIDSATVAKMLNLIDDELFFEISDAILQKNFQAVFESTEKIYQNGWDFIDFIDGLLEHFRNILSVILTNKTELVESAEIYRVKYASYIDSFSKGDLLRILNYLSKLQQELRYSNNQKLKIEIALTNLIGLERSSTISDIISNFESGAMTVKEERPSALKKDNPTVAYSTKQSKGDNKEDLEIEPYQKSEVKSKTLLVNPNINPSELNFDIIVAKWKDFLAEVNKEKALTLSPLLARFYPKNFDGINLQLQSPDESSESELMMHNLYIDKKSMEFFGKKINFRFTSSNSSKMNTESKIVTKSTKKSNSEAKTNDPYEKIIIEEMGGKEIE